MSSSNFGDEFLVLAPNVNEACCKALFDRLRQAIAQAVFDTCGGKISITISMGVATTRGDSNEGDDQFLNVADAAMYEAERKGGNRVVYI